MKVALGFSFGFAFLCASRLGGWGAALLLGGRFPFFFFRLLPGGVSCLLLLFLPLSFLPLWFRLLRLLLPLWLLPLPLLLPLFRWVLLLGVPWWAVCFVLPCLLVVLLPLGVGCSPSPSRRGRRRSSLPRFGRLVWGSSCGCVGRGSLASRFRCRCVRVRPRWWVLPSLLSAVRLPCGRSLLVCVACLSSAGGGFWGWLRLPLFFCYSYLGKRMYTIDADKHQLLQSLRFKSITQPKILWTTT